jgi:Tol biopolymer transport system component
MGVTSKRRLGAIGAGLVLAIGLGTSLAAEAGGGGAKTTRVSVSSRGIQGDMESFSPSISADGRFVAFESQATNLIRRDTNGHVDIFIRDRKRGTTRRVSVSSRGIQGDMESFSPSISANGRFVSFYSKARNLVPRDANGRRDIFVHDRETGRTRLVSVSSEGIQADGHSRSPSISADGRFVSFTSRAGNLVPGHTGRLQNIFVRDLGTGVTSLVSVSSDGIQADEESFSPSISANGRLVAFVSLADNLVPGDANDHWNVFVHDRETGETSLVSVSSTGEKGNGLSDSPSISADGRLVAFGSLADNLVPGDANDHWDVFVHDRETGETSLVSVSSAGKQGHKPSVVPAISATGRFVAFASRAGILVPGDTNGREDVFRHDRRAGTTERVSSAGREANSKSRFPSISADGRFVAFGSGATNLVRGDTNRDWDVFVRGPLR